MDLSSHCILLHRNTAGPRTKMNNGGSFLDIFCLMESCKVQIFWEGNKNLAHLPLFIWHYLVATNYKWNMGQYLNIVLLKMSFSLLECLLSKNLLVCARWYFKELSIVSNLFCIINYRFLTTGTNLKALYIYFVLVHNLISKAICRFLFKIVFFGKRRKPLRNLSYFENENKEL